MKIPDDVNDSLDGLATLSVMLHQVVIAHGEPLMAYVHLGERKLCEFDLTEMLKDLDRVNNFLMLQGVREAKELKETPKP